MHTPDRHYGRRRREPGNRETAWRVNLTQERGVEGEEGDAERRRVAGPSIDAESQREEVAQGGREL